MEVPVLLVDAGCLLPGANLRLPIRSKSNFAMIESCLLGGSLRDIALVYRVDGEKTPFETCTIAAIERVFAWTSSERQSTNYSLQLRGVARGSVRAYGKPTARVELIDDIKPSASDESSLAEFIKATHNLVGAMQTGTSRDSLRRLLVARNLEYGAIADRAVASIRTVSYHDQLAFLAECDVAKRATLAIAHINDALKDIDNTKRLATRILKELDGPLKATTNLFNDDDETPKSSTFRAPARAAAKRKLNEVEQLAADIEAVGLPKGDVADAVHEDLERLRGLSASTQDYQVLFSYLKLVAALPWSRQTKDSCDLEKANETLNADHEGMCDVKRRIMEFLAVKQLSGRLTGPILCLVGPPGVGKTSIARSIAETLGRSFQRIALGGIRDQSNIRGHRRTYVGAMPGRIINALKLAKTKNPVILLDEVDKMGESHQGDPAAALLEVLDGAQNDKFTDLFLNLPFDLSQVVFIATANEASAISRPLLDRMETLEMTSYSLDQKLRIAQRHIVPRQLVEHALQPDDVLIADDAIARIIEAYTQEAGVRELERQIAAVARWAAMRVARAINGGVVETDTRSSELNLPIEVAASSIGAILGKERYARSRSLLRHAAQNAGVALGLAVNGVGGDVLVIETSLSPGDGKLLLTGKLGDVLKESAQVAISWLRSKADVYHLDLSEFNKANLHVHMPAGAIAKDGPSAGCAFVIALFSLLTGRKMRTESACTGEISLTGKVLAVGGIKEKVLAAHRAGLRRVSLPHENRKDLVDLDASVLEQIQIIFVDTLDELLDVMMEPEADKFVAKI